MESSIFLSKAQENLQAAQLCQSNGLYNACANRAYYAMFQAAIAMLIARGFAFDPNKHFDHAQVQSAFVSEFFNRRKVLPSGLRSHLHDAEIIRGQADYKEIFISQKKARRQVAKAEELVAAIVQEVKHA